MIFATRLKKGPPFCCAAAFLLEYLRVPTLTLPHLRKKRLTNTAIQLKINNNTKYKLLQHDSYFGYTFTVASFSVMQGKWQDGLFLFSLTVVAAARYVECGSYIQTQTTRSHMTDIVQYARVLK